MAEWYDIKIRGIMGRDAGDDKEIRLLYRVVKWESDKLIYEADDKHVTNILFIRIRIRIHIHIYIYVYMLVEEGEEGGDKPNQHTADSLRSVPQDCSN